MALRIKKTTGDQTEDDEEETASSSPVEFTSQEKTEIIRFLYEKGDGGLGSLAAIQSLGQMAYSNDCSTFKHQSHAIHTAIELSDLTISEEVIQELCEFKIPETQGGKALKPCLEVCDGQGRTCLHMALLAPFTPGKIWWAEKLAELRPDLLKTTYAIKSKDGKEERVTPLQIFTEQKTVKRQELKPEKDDNAKDCKRFELLT
ncbi:hypothetical protein F5Y12DRAFT_710017 [Xylaria sp. FL1777]|nr:hypothetical protein F5Y12DRAFT_710017 [Xylaria sp. FL1777]